MYLIAGLGNPGEKYFRTRHNVGFSAIDYISQKEDISVTKLKHKALIGEGIIGGEKVILAKPQTFMNLSGESIIALSNWYKLKPSEIIIIYDDVSLDKEIIRAREKGSDGGHNGIKSIILNLGTDEFKRIKIGVGYVPPNYDMADFVLSKINDEDAKILFNNLERTYLMVKEIITGGFKSAVNKYNGRQKEQTL